MLILLGRELAKDSKVMIAADSPTSELIWAGTLTNSGFDANAVRFSTASIKGVVAIRHLLRLSSEKSPSRA